MFDKVSKILGLEPMNDGKESKFAKPYSLWTYQVIKTDEDENFDFINEFLDILEPKFTNLELIGIKREDILFWFKYEYYYQCAMEFHPQELKRLGESGIYLNIDCFQSNTDKS